MGGRVVPAGMAGGGTERSWAAVAGPTGGVACGDGDGRTGPAPVAGPGTSPRRRLLGHVLPVTLVVTGVATVAACVVVLPRYLVAREVGDRAAREMAPAVLLEAANHLRATLLQGAVALVVLVAVVVAWRQLQLHREQLEHNHELARAQLELSAEERVTQRLSQAVQHLDGELHVRLGGIFTLERIARGSPADRVAIGEVLTAYVRRGRSDAAGDATAPPPPLDQLPPLRARAPDVQAAVTVLGRREPAAASDPPLVLNEVDLRRADLAGVHLEGAELYAAHLEGADLSDAHLEGAYLRGAYLRGARLEGANLEGTNLRQAHLEGVNLRGAKLRDAHLEGARLEGAHLEEAYLRDAHLEGAYLEGAHLDGAHLEGTSLEGTSLREAHLERASLRDANLDQARLEGAYLRGAHLEGARLVGAHLERTYLRDGNLEGAALDGAHLDGAHLAGASLAGARADVSTRWPHPGFDLEAAGVVVDDG